LKKKKNPIPVLSLLFTSISNSKPALQIITHIRTSGFRNVKICICLEGSDKIKAIEYGEKALSSYQTQLKRLISETQSSSKSVEAQTSSDSESSSATQIDPSIQKKKNERSMLIKILSKLQFKVICYV
jgi:hypothetical protein